MELTIGKNIRRMRQEKGLTQERLAEIIGVSAAAVSKWESADIYPDITLIFPLARFFGVSADALMGYDAAKCEADILSVLEEYSLSEFAGTYEKSREILRRARKTYPDDYRIMHAYMWNLAGGAADNNSERLLRHAKEFSKICDCILDGCTDEYIRLEALNMRAKLAAAEGKIGEALEILDKFPTFYQSSGQKKEQLFAKDTPEFLSQATKNLYELAEFTADKAAKVKFFAPGERAENIARAEKLGDILAQIRAAHPEEAVFAVMERNFFGRLSNDATYRGGSDADVIRLLKKYFAACDALTTAAKNDRDLSCYIAKIHKGVNSSAEIAEYLLSLKNPVVGKLRENPEYLSLLRSRVLKHTIGC